LLFPFNVSPTFSVSKKTLYRLALAIVLLYFVLVCAYRWSDTTPPIVTLIEPFTRVGPTTPLSLRIEDHETGLQEITGHIDQNRERDPLVHEQFSAGRLPVSGRARGTFELHVVPFGDNTIPRRRGPARLVITARDHSWRGFFEGNWTRFEQDVTVKFAPPQIEILSPPLSIAQSGAGLLLYRVSEDATGHGVQIVNAFLPGYHNTVKAFSMFSLFAFPHDLPASTPIQLMADDELGNHGEQKITARVRGKQWRTRQLNISDRFIEQTILPIIDRTPDLDDLADPLQNFLQVNKGLRQHNTRQISALAAHSRQAFLWNGAFLQLSKSQVEAAFADHRRYRYRGQVVDTQDHLGFDLAVTAHYPVEAANDGEVVLADYVGIYGNTIVIDHGYGLQSLYAHLSSFNVERGDTIAKGHVIGRSGTTGLAAGDHLHFSLLLHGVQINPMEWWDAQWVQSHISDHIRQHEAVDPPSQRDGALRRPSNRSAIDPATGILSRS